MRVLVDRSARTLIELKRGRKWATVIKMRSSGVKIQEMPISLLDSDYKPTNSNVQQAAKIYLRALNIRPDTKEVLEKIANNAPT